MKYILIYISIYMSLLEASQEFIYIEPISIEYPTIKKIVAPKIDKVIEIVKEEENNTTQNNPWLISIDGDKNITTMEKDKDDDEYTELESTELPKDTDAINFILNKNGSPQKYILLTKFKDKEFSSIDAMSTELVNFSKFLQKNRSYQVLIYSYTDSIGEEDENKILTKKRANAIKNILMNLGVSSTKLTAIGKGEKKPIQSNIHQEGRAANNRIEIELIN